jgi:UDP-N-acetylglucosamine 3-dehydrogenase
MIKTVVIGLGNMGRHHVKHLSTMKDASLVAVCDVNQERVNQFANEYNCQGFTSVDIMLAEAKPQAVCIIAPTSLHFEIAKKVLEANAHVFIEKPISSTLAEADALIALAASRNKILTVGHIERFNPTVMALNTLLESGAIGKPVAITAHRASPMPTQIQDANVMLDLAVHDIDLVNWLMKSTPVKGSAQLEKAQLTDREDSASLFLNYPSGSAVVQVNWITPFKIRHVQVTATQGYAMADTLNHTLTVWKAGGSTHQNILIQQHDALKAELNEFLASILENRQPLVTGSDAKNALAIALSPIF